MLLHEPGLNPGAPSRNAAIVDQRQPRPRRQIPLRTIFHWQAWLGETRLRSSLGAAVARTIAQ
jgi:hypothetical protein